MWTAGRNFSAPAAAMQIMKLMPAISISLTGLPVKFKEACGMCHDDSGI